jgi:hypothetical protein
MVSPETGDTIEALGDGADGGEDGGADDGAADGGADGGAADGGADDGELPPPPPPPPPPQAVHSVITTSAIPALSARIQPPLACLLV